MSAKLNELLKWSIEAQTNPDGTVVEAPAEGNTTTTTRRQLDPEVMAALFGGPSEAELMKAAMEVIHSSDPEVTLENKLIAFDNFEQLIESLDNANNLENLSLWTPLISLLEHEEEEIRRYAAWCIGTSVQNNAKTQERLLAMGGIPKLVQVATKKDESEANRRKAVYALSSAVRNYQPAMDAAAEHLAEAGHALLAGGDKKVDAANMDAVDEIMDWLKAEAKKAAASA